MLDPQSPVYLASVITLWRPPPPAGLQRAATVIRTQTLLNLMLSTVEMRPFGSFLLKSFIF